MADTDSPSELGTMMLASRRPGRITGLLSAERARNPLLENVDHAMTYALEMAGLAAAVLDGDGRITTMNGLFRLALVDISVRRRSRLTLPDPAADMAFELALIQLTGPGRRADDAGRTIPLPARHGHPAMILRLLPLGAPAASGPGRAMLVTTPVRPHAVPGAEVLQGLFGLTPAEARVARCIGEGKTIETIAASLGTSRETVRTQLKVVLAKIGIRRQVELAALLSGVGSIPIGSA